MKRLLLLLVIFLSFNSSAQEASVEKSVFGIQTGFFGIWVHNESRLTNSIALRTEIGLDGGIFDGYWWDKTGVIFGPGITLEPRWYYNLNKRVDKGRRIDGNSGNFVSLKTSYRPDLFTISNYDNLSVVPHISFIPTWGIRRNLGRHFNYETGIGIGYINHFTKYSGSEGEAVLNLHLKIGYRFR